MPHSGSYIEVLNSDAKVFAGANRVNSKAIKAQMIPWHNRPQSMEITLPEFTICVFKVKKIITPSELEKKVKREKKSVVEQLEIPLMKSKKSTKQTKIAEKKSKATKSKEKDGSEAKPKKVVKKTRSKKEKEEKEEKEAVEK